jgi:hypothetical protein
LTVPASTKNLEQQQLETANITNHHPPSIAIKTQDGNLTRLPIELLLQIHRPLCWNQSDRVRIPVHSSCLQVRLERNTMSGSHERSYLFYKPSPCSTDKLTKESDGDSNDATSYQSLIVSREDSSSPEIQLPTLGRRQLGSQESFYYEYVKGKSYQRHRWLIYVIMVVLGGAVVLRTIPNQTGVKPMPDFKSSSRAFSTLDPVLDLGLVDFNRSSDSQPPKVLTRRFTKEHNAFPTNSWYQNMLLLRGEKPSPQNRAYTTPYVVDAAGPIPGLRVHANHVDASTNEIHVTMNENFGVTLGAASEKSKDVKPSFGYNILHMTPLGLTVEWVRRFGDSLFLLFHSTV